MDVLTLQPPVNAVMPCRRAASGRAGGRARNSNEEVATIYPAIGEYRRSASAGRDGMPRFPSIASAAGILRGADYIGTCVFAVSGAVTAATVGMDILGCTAIGTITAVGGGTIRDAIILHKQPFWISEPEYVAMAASCAALAFLLWPLLPSGNSLKDHQGQEGAAMWWGDALGVGAFAVVGAMNAMRMCVHPAVVAPICGMVTSTFGGLTRDVICGLPNKEARGRIFHSKSDIYATTALVGASVYVAGVYLSVPLAARILLGVSSAMGLRFAAKHYNIGLPTWNKMNFKLTPKTSSENEAFKDKH